MELFLFFFWETFLLVRIYPSELFQMSNNYRNQFLEQKYPEMCELCDDRVNCTYINTESHGHAGALDCLTSGRGQVAYVSLQVVRDYFAVSICYSRRLHIIGVRTDISLEQNFFFPLFVY